MYWYNNIDLYYYITIAITITIYLYLYYSLLYIYMLIDDEDEEDEDEDEEESSQVTENNPNPNPNTDSNPKPKKKNKKKAIDVHGDEDDLLAISELENVLKTHSDQQYSIKSKRHGGNGNGSSSSAGSAGNTGNTGINTDNGDKTGLNHENSAIGLQNHHNNLHNNQMASTAGVDEDGNTVPMAYTTNGNIDDGSNMTKIVGVNGLENNLKNFNNNPIYSIVVNEPCSLILTLYQSDRRWSIMRLSEGIGAPGTTNTTGTGTNTNSGVNNNRDITSSEFSFRSERLASCMKYPVAIGFAIIKLSGTHSRISNYRHRKVVATSKNVEYSNVVSGGTINLRPGRYAIIPYTHEVLDRSMSYVLHAQYLLGQIDFENEDLVDERPDDDSGSGMYIYSVWCI